MSGEEKIEVIGIGDFGANVINKTKEIILEHNVYYEIVNEENKKQVEMSLIPKIEYLNTIIIVVDFKQELDRKIALEISKIINKKVFTVVIGSTRDEEKDTADLKIPIISIPSEANINEIIRYGYFSIKAFIELLYETRVCMDLADLKMLFSDSSLWNIGYGKSEGKNKIKESVEQALNCSMIQYNLEEIKDCIILISGGENLNLHEVNNGTEIIQNSLNSETNIIFTYCINKKVKVDEMSVTVFLGK